MSRVIWSERSLLDLRAIDNRLTANAGGSVSGRILRAARSRARAIIDYPRLGRPVPDMDLRVLRASRTPGLIVYRCRDDGVEIARIRHERENWQIKG